ncbi:MAG TPA: glucuronate isomerase [Acholeplasmatales bacterium]|nr:MAG: glucuronate isomerase [Tenericutes bacterium GWF2_57_13]HAQ57361.1 glucuronate isomerase [Acholeplasmatales bacterium]
MTAFINEDFLLHSEPAKRLYHGHAERMPIIDYHCHLDPREIYENKTFRNLFDVWLSGDHYKWRLMRANGVTEDYITGNKSDYEKFLKWAETVPLLIGNPLYHWTHLELKRYFGIDDLLSPSTAKRIYDAVTEKLALLPARKLIEMSGVEVVCTTDDPADTLAWHAKIRADKSIRFKVLPAFRPDKVVNVELSWFCSYVQRLSKTGGTNIATLADLKGVLRARIDHFHENGCRLADHALDVVMHKHADEAEVAEIFAKAIAGITLSESEIAKYKGHMMVFFGREYSRRGWVQQYHIGAFRNVSSRMFTLLGPDTGFDAISDGAVAQPLSALIDALDVTGELPKTILYTLNPRDFEVAITLMQSFQGGGIPGKIQFGSPWWFLDTIDGMTKQIKALGNNGLLARFVGMLTDSRSFLSYPRHEYFRRLLCDLFGTEIERGHFPDDEELLGRIIEDISYKNAKNYFGF